MLTSRWLFLVCSRRHTCFKLGFHRDRHNHPFVAFAVEQLIAAVLPVGDVYCITRYRDKSVNLRTIIRRSGFESWPKLFQNFRSTHETELFKMTNDNIKTVSSWIGNSPKVALEHYTQVTEADLKEADKMSLLSDGEKAA